mmetsp:Transcript_37595/g.111560  ORF Transcript_37595/g.111560 Transcript_37595/m.111560 type:complete len:210 (+) Transcript_37595:1411-2040(+)
MTALRGDTLPVFTLTYSSRPRACDPILPVDQRPTCASSTLLPKSRSFSWWCCSLDRFLTSLSRLVIFFRSLRFRWSSILSALSAPFESCACARLALATSRAAWILAWRVAAFSALSSSSLPLPAPTEGHAVLAEALSAFRRKGGDMPSAANAALADALSFQTNLPSGSLRFSRRVRRSWDSASLHVCFASSRCESSSACSSSRMAASGS